jgi:hypothetical protein
MIKKCACCGQDFKTTPYWVKMMGNYCRACSGNIGRIVRVRTLLKDEEKNKGKIKALMRILKKWSVPCSLGEIKTSQSAIDMIGEFIKNPTA